MKLEDQVTNLELSKKLKELGMKQESLYYWGTWFGGGWSVNKPIEDIENIPDSFVSAFSVAELGEMLPVFGNIFWTIYKDDNQWEYNLKKHAGDSEDWIYEAIEDTEANARAKMLIYLIENGLLK